MNNVVKIGTTPVAQGGFGEVWEGLLKGHAIAIKEIRVWQNGMDRLFKVRLLRTQTKIILTRE
jgi:hypothetical protein